MLGWGEGLIVLVLVFLIFGSRKLPALGSAIGESLKNFKKALNEKDVRQVTEIETDEKKKP